MTDKPSDKPLPFYVSYSTLTTFLDWLKEMEVTPTLIDRSLWTGKFAGGNGGQLMAGLRFLGLLEGEKPTEPLEGLVRADASQRKGLLADTLRTAYGDDLIDKLPSTTPNMLNKALDDLGATESTRRKAFSFLVNAARGADLPMAQAISKRARNKPSKTGTGRKATRRGGEGGQQGEDRGNDSPPPPPEDKSPYAGVGWLVQQLPPQREWAEAERTRWMAALTAAVDWVVTVTDDESAESAKKVNPSA